MQRATVLDGIKAKPLRGAYGSLDPVSARWRAGRVRAGSVSQRLAAAASSRKLPKEAAQKV